jgi:hypothetical protein
MMEIVEAVEMRRSSSLASGIYKAFTMEAVPEIAIGEAVAIRAVICVR